MWLPLIINDEKESLIRIRWAEVLIQRDKKYIYPTNVCKKDVKNT